MRNDQKKNLKRKIRLIMKERRMRYIEESGIERRKQQKIRQFVVPYLGIT